MNINQSNQTTGRECYGSYVCKFQHLKGSCVFLAVWGFRKFGHSNLKTYHLFKKGKLPKQFQNHSHSFYITQTVSQKNCQKFLGAKAGDHISTPKTECRSQPGSLVVRLQASPDFPRTLSPQLRLILRVEWRGRISFEPMLDTLEKIESKISTLKRWRLKLFEIPIEIAMCENWNSSKELRVRKMIFSLSLSFWFRGRVSGSVSALFSTRIGFSRFWGQISMLGAQNMTHQRVMNLWKPTILLKDYLLGLYRKKIIGKVYFNTQHLPPKTSCHMDQITPQVDLPGPRTRQELRRLSTSNRLRQTCCTKHRPNLWIGKGMLMIFLSTRTSWHHHQVIWVSCHIFWKKC